MIRFLPLAIEDRESVARVLADADRANGCAFSGLAAAAAPLPPELTYGAGLRGAGTPTIPQYIGEMAYAGHASCCFNAPAC